MIGEILEKNVDVRDTYYLLKHWVKCRLAVPDKSPAFYGLLNSFSWVLLFIYHNIKLGYLPPYNDLDKPVESLPREFMLDNLETFFEFMLEQGRDRNRINRKISVYEG